jgi:nitroreductase
METWDAIRSRRNVRNYKPEPVPEEGLRQILEAGRRTLSGGNYQHWDFIVVTGPEQLAELATVWQGAQFIAAAPAAIALVMPYPADPDALNTDEYDLGQATYAMMLAATDLGVGTGHSLVGDQAKARMLLGVPDTHFVAYLLGLGYPASRPLQPVSKLDRRPFDEVVHSGRWHTRTA